MHFSVCKSSALSLMQIFSQKICIRENTYAVSLTCTPCFAVFPLLYTGSWIMPVIHSPILTVSKRGNLKMWKLPTLPMVSCIARAAPVQVCDNRLNKTIWNAYNFWSYYWHRHAIISSRPSIISPGSLISEFLPYICWGNCSEADDYWTPSMTHTKNRVFRAQYYIVHTYWLLTHTHTHTLWYTVMHTL